MYSKKNIVKVILIILALISLSTFFLYKSGREEEFRLSDSLLQYAPEDGQAPETIKSMRVKYKDENKSNFKELELQKKIDSIAMDEIIEGLSGIELQILEKEDLGLLKEDTIIEIYPWSGISFTEGYSYVTDTILIYSTGDIVFVGPMPLGEIVPKSSLYTNLYQINDRIEKIRNAIEKAYSLKNP